MKPNTSLAKQAAFARIQSDPNFVEMMRNAQRTKERIALEVLGAKKRAG